MKRPCLNRLCALALLSTGCDGGGPSVEPGPAAPRPTVVEVAASPAPPRYRLREVPAGGHSLGCTPGQGPGCEGGPARQVDLPYAILVGETEVSQGLYAAVQGENPASSVACGPDCPVEFVSWEEALVFANALSAREGLEPCYVLPSADPGGAAASWPAGPACRGYRLPTELEWEVAARGGVDQPFAGGPDSAVVAWTVENSGGTTHPVAQLQPNGYGLYDMSGNVFEWTWDPYVAPGADPSAANDGRVLRGGCWAGGAALARVSGRSSGSAGYRHPHIGLRLVRTAP